MSNPRQGDEAAVKRAARYLRRYPVAVYLYAWQPGISEISVYTDSDWGGTAAVGGAQAEE